MKNIVNIIVTILCMLFASITFSKTPDQDAFQACMSQTKQDRLACAAGCGMILQQCYDQGIADLNGKITNLLSEVASLVRTVF